MKVRVGANTFETTRQADGTYVSTLAEAVNSYAAHTEALDNHVLLAEFPSASGNDPHYVRWSKGLGVYCTCVGYGYRRYCRYTRFINHLIDTQETTLEALAKQPIRVK